MTSAYAPLSILRQTLCHASKATNNKANLSSKNLSSKKNRAALLLLLAIALFAPRMARADGIGYFASSSDYNSQTLTTTNSLSTAIANAYSGLIYIIDNGGIIDNNITITRSITINTKYSYQNGNYTLKRNGTYTITVNSGITLTIKNIIIDGNNIGHNIALFKCYGTIIMEGWKTDESDYEPENCKIINCVKKNSNDLRNGSAIHVLNSSGRLICNSVTFSDNQNRDLHNPHNGMAYGGGALAFHNGATFSLTNCHFKNNEGYESAGAIFLEYPGTSSITDCTFTSNKSYWAGGAIFGIMDDYAKLDIKGNTVFNSNRVDYSSTAGLLQPKYLGLGGAIYFLSGTYCTFNIGDGTNTVRFENNYARYGGGALCLFCESTKSKFNLQNFSMTGNWASNDGTVPRPNAVDGGGAIFIFGSTDSGHSEDHLVINNGTISNNHAVGHGGAMLVSFHDSKVENVTFEENYTTASNSEGGAVMILGNTDAYTHYNQFIKCNFYQNGINGSTTTTKHGGALCSRYKTNLQVLGCTIGGSAANANKVTGNGGGIYIGGSGYLTMDTKIATSPAAYNTMEVSYNEAREDGGGLFISSGSTGRSTIGNNGNLSNKVIISNNRADNQGGGLFNSGGILTMSNSTVSNNEAGNYHHGQGGGGIYVLAVKNASGTGDSNIPVLLNGITISDNKAYGCGGGIYVAEEGGSTGWAGPSVLVRNCDIDRNYAKADPVNLTPDIGNGGGIYAHGSKITSGSYTEGYLKISGGNIRKNEAQQNNCPFDNRSIANGGGLFLYSGTVRIDGCSIGGDGTANTASRNGGGIKLHQDADVTLTGSTKVTYNTATNGGGIYALGNLVLDGTSCTISNNVANASSGLGGGVNISHAEIDDPEEIGFVGTLNLNMLPIDPGYVDPGEFGYQVFSGNTLIETFSFDGIPNEEMLAPGTYTVKLVKNDGITDFSSLTSLTLAISDIDGTITPNGGSAINNEAEITFTTYTDGYQICTFTVTVPSGIGGTLTMDNGATIGTDNSAAYGGGLYLGTGTVANFNSGSVNKNSATINGGGIYNHGILNCVSSLAVSNNLANGKGGGIFNADAITCSGTATLTVNNNSAIDGAGIYDNGTLTLEGSGAKNITSNNASGNGGGLWTAGRHTQHVPEYELPTGYQQLEYLRATNQNSYINTGLTLNTNYTFEVTSCLAPNTSNAALIYAGTYTNEVRTGCLIYAGTIIHKWDASSTASTATINYSTPGFDDISLYSPFKLRQNRTGITITQGSNSCSLSVSGLSNTTSNEAIQLFRSNPNTGFSANTTIYEAKIYGTDGTTPLRHFVPARRISDNVIGMIDVVNNVFYTSASTYGTFTAGPDVSSSGASITYNVNVANTIFGGNADSKNQAVNGAGIYINTDGILPLRGCTVTYNHASVKGGGVYKLGSLWVSEYNDSGKAYHLMNITENTAGTSGAKAVVPENVYIPPMSADDQTILIIGELTCGSRIGVTKTKNFGSGSSVVPHYGDINGDGSVTAADNGDHVYKNDDNLNQVKTPIAANQTPGTTTPSDTRYALNAFKRNVFFDDKENYSVWCFNYQNENGTNYQSATPSKTAYQIDSCYFIETWRSYANPSGFVSNRVSTPAGLAQFAKIVNTSTENANTNATQTTDIDLAGHYWEPIGFATDNNCGLDYLFNGSYNGNGHLIQNTMSILPTQTMGLFGNVSGTVKHTFAIEGDLTYTFIGANGSLGGLVGNVASGGIIDGCESALFSLIGYSSSCYAGGIAGMVAGEMRNSFAACNNITTATATNITASGGMVGQLAAGGAVKNGYAINAVLTGSSQGVLVGSNSGTLQNCYSHYTSGTESTNVYVNGSSTAYSPTITTDNLGYMYSDNLVNDTPIPMFEQLNDIASSMNGTTGHTYALWARPTLAKINGDLPVLLLDDYGGSGESGQGGFRSLGNVKTSAESTTNHAYVLQYSGPNRDSEGNTPSFDKPELDGALNREGAGKSLFIYGDITEKPTVTPSADEISIYEHAAILAPGTLGDYANTYVGITFDNSNGHAYSTPGINHLGSQLLPRDWHMFSTPLANAPLGFNYIITVNEENVNTNSAQYYPENPNGNAVDFGPYYNNPWPYLHQQAPNTEFHWLSGNNRGRYWMKAYSDADGYFPTAVDGTAVVESDNLFIVGSDECPSSGQHRYPYGMDLYCWYEPEPHWINFKRNGPNHWHSDEYDENNHLHAHLAYTENGNPNQNEDNLVVGKGYMASISIKTYLQSHGNLNKTTTALERNVTVTGDEKISGWNLVGNPFHAYLDFNKFADNESDNQNANDNYNLIAKRESHPFYVVYDADKYDESPGSAFRYYPADCSVNGEYAGRYLHPHQGFYVKATESGTLKFDENMIVTRSALIPDKVDLDGHFRDGNFDDIHPAYPLVNLYLSSERGCADITVIEFERPEGGGAPKMKELRSGNGLFYTRVNNQNYAALFTKAGTERVPLWFEAKEYDIFTMKWNTANGEFHSMHLVDNLTGIRYDMLAHDSYTFEGSPDDYPSRFYITFKLKEDPQGEEPEDDESTTEAHPHFAFFDGSEWVVTGEGLVDFIDLQGRVLLQTQVDGQSLVNLPKVASGLYMFRLNSNKDVKVQKVIITNN